MRAQDFEWLYREQSEPLLGLLHYLTGSPHVAEDLLADTFERAFSARRRFDRSKGKERTWIHAIALNCYRDYLRRRKVEARAVERVAFLSSTAGPGKSTDDMDDRAAVLAALDCLSAEERESIALRYGAGLSVPEIAQVTGTPRKTVEGRVYRSLRKLRPKLFHDGTGAPAVRRSS